MKRPLTLLLLVGLVGCGGNSGISKTASARLTPQVEAIKAAATGGDSTAAYERLGELRHSVTELRQAGELNEREASEVLAASDKVEAQLAALAPAPTASRAGTAKTTTTLNEEEKGEGQDERDHKEDRKDADQERDKDKGKGQ